MRDDSPASGLSAADHRTLLEVARGSIASGLREGHALAVTPDSFSPPLRREAATFVTLEMEGRLRGCIGSHQPRRPLVRDVAENAFSAAFRDPRFRTLSEEEFRGIDLHISLLSSLEAMAVLTEEDLLRSLRPGTDGLLLEDPPHRSLFLPQVWASLTQPEEFLRHLKLKAGLSEAHWSPAIRFHRFTVAEIRHESAGEVG